MRTENLLQQSQQLTIELQTRQTELQQTNEELASKAKQLAEQNVEVERKNKEVEQARRALEEKAAELALTSKYKSEFLANMSHELRTPLNSILILGQQLAENAGGNLTAKQVEFARNIHSAGTDLLTLINDILDLSKIESGTVTVEAEEITFAALRDNVERTFRHVAEAKNLAFHVDIDDDAAARRSRATRSACSRSSRTCCRTRSSSPRRATSRCACSRSTSGWSPDHPVLRFAPSAVAFAVEDTGIGIAPEKQRLIFEAFQQADAGTSRKYGGTGLGLAISRELATLLGGEIRLVERAGAGQHVHAVPAARPTPARRARSPRRRRASAATRRPAVAAAGAGGRQGAKRSSPTTATTSRRATRVLLIVEDDPHYARILLGLARDKGFKGIVANRGQPALSLARAVPADGDHARRLPARHARLDGAQQPQARSGDAPHPGADPVGRRGAAARAVARRVLLPGQAGDHRGSRAARSTGSRAYVAPHTKRLLVVEDNDIERESIVELLGHDDIEIAAVGTGAEALDALHERAVRLLRPRPAAAGHERLRAARDRCRRSRRCATSRSSSSPARS